MPNHLTPEELSKELGIDRQEVIKVCVQESIPIYQGKIDKTLFQAQLQALRECPQRLELSLEQRLVDLALVDRDRLLDADLDHLLAIDPKLLRQLLWRQVVRHRSSSLTGKNASHLSQQKSSSAHRPDELISQLPFCCRQESKALPSQVVHAFEE